MWSYNIVLPMLALLQFGKLYMPSVSQDLDIIYTCDHHFLHDEFKKLKVEIINPIDEWMMI